MQNTQENKEHLKEAERRIDWVLAHPAMSDWLKNTLRGARERDPVAVLNDLEMLNHLLRPRAEAQIAQSSSELRERLPFSRPGDSRSSD